LIGLAVVLFIADISLPPMAYLPSRLVAFLRGLMLFESLDPHSVIADDIIPTAGHGGFFHLRCGCGSLATEMPVRVGKETMLGQNYSGWTASIASLARSSSKANIGTRLVTRR